MTILVTGGAGFIGSHVCEALLSQGEKVLCLDNFNDYYNPSFKQKNIQNSLKNPNFKLIKDDITDINALSNVFENNSIKKIIHLAAMAGVRNSIENPFIYEKINIGGTLNLLQLATKFQIENFVFGSSSSIYGLNSKLPFSEEDDTQNIISPYGATKRAAEILCQTYYNLHSLNSVCLRFFTVYGPRNRPDMAVYKFTKAIDSEKPIYVYGEGTKRDYTYVADIVQGILAALKIRLGFEIINLGNSETVPINELISCIEENLGKKAIIEKKPLHAADAPATFADINKAKKLLEYNPKTNIAQGIKSFVEWYKC